MDNKNYFGYSPSPSPSSSSLPTQQYPTYNTQGLRGQYLLGDNQVLPQPQSTYSTANTSFPYSGGGTPPTSTPMSGSGMVRVQDYLNPHEIQALDVMRQRALQEGINVPDEKLVESLMARKFEVDRAILLLKNQLEWQWEHASELVLDDIILKEMATCKVMTPNARGKAGAQIIYFIPRFYDPRESNPLSVFRMTYYMINRLVSDIQTQRNGFLIIVDLMGTGWRNCDLKLPGMFVKMMQNRFSGRLHLVLILYPPKLFRMMFGMVRPFIPEKYLCKIRVVTPTELFQYVDPSNLLPDYGGTMAFNQNDYINMIMAENQQQTPPQQQPTMFNTFYGSAKR